MAEHAHTTSTPIARRRAARPAGGVLDRRGARIGTELQEAQDRGEVAEAGGDRQSNVRTADNGSATLSDIGIPRQRASNIIPFPTRRQDTQILTLIEDIRVLLDERDAARAPAAPVVQFRRPVTRTLLEILNDTFHAVQERNRHLGQGDVA